MFGADISPSANIDNNKKYILIGKGPAYGLNNTALTAEKEFLLSNRRNFVYASIIMRWIIISLLTVLKYTNSKQNILK